MTESPHTLPPAPSDDEIDLRELFRVLWAGKWLIGGITFAAIVLAVIISLTLPNIYRADTLLAPNDRAGAGGLPALAAQYGGLASLAGINIGGGQPDKTALGLEILKSRKFVSEFIERRDILVPLMAATGWNQETDELEIDSNIFDVSTNKWVGGISRSGKTIPSQQQAYEMFIGEILSVAQDKKTGFVTIAVQHYSPSVAKQWVDWLIEDINLTIMRQDVDAAEQAIEYLNKQIAATSLADLQNVFFRLIEEQTKTVMLAEVSDEYLFKTLDPAVIPEQRAKPKRTYIVLASAFLAGTLGMLLVLAMSLRVDSRQNVL